MMRAFILALLVSGCAGAQPAPISYGGGQRQPARAPVTRANPPPSVEAPERANPQPAAAPNWADGEGTPLSTYALQPSDVQPYDPAQLPRTHRVGANEGLYDIATRYQVPMLALIEQNGLQPPYALRPGSELQLPPPRFHTVARGEEFADVARRYEVDPRSLALLNRMQSPYRVRPGDRIVLPAMARAIEAAEPAPSVAPRREDSVPRASVGSGRFTWPLRGEVVARYGAQPSGERLDGIEISGREGAAIVSAGEGDVVYAGADLPAYGTLILVRHADNYVTAYGHARRALVREGQHVRAGEAIAELGPRSDGRPRLLFQVRQGSTAVDPAPLLGQ